MRYKLLFPIRYVCNPVQSCVPWTAAATVSVPEGCASAKRAGWDPPAKNGPATRTARSTASARTGGVSAAPAGKGTTAPLVRAFCTSRKKMHKIVTSYAKVCQSHRSGSSQFGKTETRSQAGCKRCLCIASAACLSHRIAAHCSCLEEITLMN